VVKAGEMLYFIDTPQQLLFKDVHGLVGASPGRHIHRESALEAIMDRMAHEDHERMFNTFIRWSRYGGLFHYDEAEQRLGLDREHA
jgi:hypothetical protein